MVRPPRPIREEQRFWELTDDRQYNGELLTDQLARYLCSGGRGAGSRTERH